MKIHHNAKTHEAVETPLGIVLKEVAPEPVEIWPTQVALNFPKIPYHLFLLICSWQMKIAHAHKCESATSLFLIDGQWQAVPFFQENDANSMTIKVDFKDEDNAIMLDEMMQKAEMGMHATLHNHVMAGAGQSGTDVADEKHLFGPHITIGNLNCRTITFHARLSIYIGAEHKFIPLHFCDIIDVPVPPGATKEELDKIATGYLTMGQSKMPAYPEEWANRFTLTKPVGRIHYSNYGNGLGYTYGGEDELFDSQKKSSSGGVSSADSEDTAFGLESMLQDLPSWPDGIIFSLDTTDEVRFRSSLMKSPNLVEEAAIAICHRLKFTNFEQLRVAMVELETKNNETKKENATDNQASK